MYSIRKPLSLFKLLLLTLLLSLGTSAFGQGEKLLAFLEGHPEIEVKPCLLPDGYASAYTLFISQPLDHTAPEKGTFKQRVYLSHMHRDSAMVIVTEGYDRTNNRMYELSEMLGANQLDVEHRFYGESIPEDFDWQYLTIEQATADYHHINDIFNTFYSKSWVSTGISKGGQTSIFYRYFYPDDVKATVPYVAPINLSLEDKRIYSFLDNIGSKACRNELKRVQLELFENKEEALSYLRFYAKGAKLTFNTHENGLETAFEYAVLEYPFSFWQWGHKCEDIPKKGTSIEALVNYLLAVSGIDFFSDKDIAYYGSHYYQCGAQFGYYGYNPEGFEQYLTAIKWDENNHPSAIFMPENTTITFNPELVQKVYDWTQTSGNQMIYINGANDTWSATGVPASAKVDALWFVMKDQSHGTARIANMNEDEKRILLKALRYWMSH